MHKTIYTPTPKMRAMSFSILIFCLIFDHEVILARVLPLFMHIFKAAFYFHSGGDHEVFCGQITFMDNEKETVITHLKELLTVLLMFCKQYKLHRSAEVASRIALCFKHSDKSSARWATLTSNKPCRFVPTEDSLRNHIPVFKDVELDLGIFQFVIRSQTCWVTIYKSLCLQAFCL